MVTFIFFKSPSSSGDEVRQGNMQAALNREAVKWSSVVGSLSRTRKVSLGL